MAGLTDTETSGVAQLVETTITVNVRELVVRIIASAVVFGLALFLPAGTLIWPAGWIYLVLLFTFIFVASFWLLRFNPGLLAERMSGVGKPGQKTWDKVFLALTALIFFAWFGLMAFDAVRFTWSSVPAWLQWFGALLLLSSFYVFYRTLSENSFLSPAVRIQRERGQTVVSTGLYRYVRHPMYAGFGLFALGTTFLLGSIYGLLGALLLIAMVAWRAVQEERVLREELEGYNEYMSRVRYRIVPRVW